MSQAGAEQDKCRKRGPSGREAAEMAGCEAENVEMLRPVTD